jgi:hypothetical protein
MKREVNKSKIYYDPLSKNVELQNSKDKPIIISKA